jgi:hypothetical protein
MTMTPGLRKFARPTHVTLSVGWLGALGAFLALANAGVGSEDAQIVRAAGAFDVTPQATRSAAWQPSSWTQDFYVCAKDRQTASTKPSNSVRGNQCDHEQESSGWGLTDTRGCKTSHGA